MTSKELLNSILEYVQSTKETNPLELTKEIAIRVNEGIDKLGEEEAKDMLKAFLIQDIVTVYIHPIIQAEKKYKDLTDRYPWIEDVTG